MKLQAQLNNQALDYFPKIKELITNAEAFEANQMRCKTLDIISRYRVPLNEAFDGQNKIRQELIINTFYFNEWITDKDWANVKEINSARG